MDWEEHRGPGGSQRYCQRICQFCTEVLRKDCCWMKYIKINGKPGLKATDVCFTEDYSEPYVGPCHLLNLDTTSIKLVWKYTKRNSNFGTETATAFVTTTVSHRK